MTIPIANIAQQNTSLKTEIDAAIAQVIKQSAFIGTSQNPFIQSFEQNFAQYIGVNHCITCANGTDAIEIALCALGIGVGDEVLVPAVSWISSAEAVNNVGAMPVFVDIDLQTYIIDSQKIESAITFRTKAIIVVHLFGQAAEMDAINAIAKKHQLLVIEDCAQAHGALYHNKKVGSLSDISTFSFFPSKNLGAMGDGGCMLTNNADLAETCRLITNHGQKTKGNHIRLGRNSRLDGIQAAFLDVKLPFLDSWNTLRKQKADLYGQLLKDVVVQLPNQITDTEHVFHLFVIRSTKRDILFEHLRKNGVEANIHYRKPLPMLEPYRNSYVHGDYEKASLFCDTALSLPIVRLRAMKLLKWCAIA